MSKIAILVIAANVPKILGRVLHHFDNPRFRVFLHVDAKVDLQKYRKDAGGLENVTFLENRSEVYWGGFSMIEAELALIREALADPEISRVTFWSDDTCPLRSPDATYEFLMGEPDRIATEVHDYAQAWYRKFYYFDSRFTTPLKMDVNRRDFGPSDWKMMQRIQQLVERGKRKLEKVYFSRQWIALSRESLETMLDYIEHDEHLIESFRFSLFPDETFFPTLFKLCFPDKVVGDIPMFANYGGWPVPYVYGKLNEIPTPDKLPNHLFVRKIWPESTFLVDALTERW